MPTGSRLRKPSHRHLSDSEDSDSDTSRLLIDEVRIDEISSPATNREQISSSPDLDVIAITKKRKEIPDCRLHAEYYCAADQL